MFRVGIVVENKSFVLARFTLEMPIIYPFGNIQ